MTGLGSQQRMAADAFVVEHACIGRHGLALRMTACRAGDHRLERDHGHVVGLTVEGNPALVVASVNVEGLTLSGSNVTVAVFSS